MRKIFVYVVILILSVAGILFLVFDEVSLAITAFILAASVVLALLIKYLKDYQYKQKLDPDYGLLKEEYFLEEYDRITKLYEKKKIRAITLCVITFSKDYEKEMIKEVSLIAKKEFPFDLISFDETLNIVFVNLHKNLLTKTIDTFKQRLKEKDLKVSFTYKTAFYASGDNYEALKGKIKK